MKALNDTFDRNWRIGIEQEQVRVFTRKREYRKVARTSAYPMDSMPRYLRPNACDIYVSLL